MPDNKLTYTAILLYALGAVILLACLMMVSYWPPAQNQAMLSALISGTFGTLIGHILTVLNTGSTAAPATAPPPVPAAQAGFALWPLLAVLVLVAMGLALSGCASLTQAGNTAYSLKPVLGADGKATSCEFNATDGKEYASRSLAVTVGAEGCQAIVHEGASSAFQGQAIAGKALSVLPAFAAPILNPGPASLGAP